MSDEEETFAKRQQKNIHYGSLEAEMENRMKHIRAIENEHNTSISNSNTQISEYFNIESEM